MDDETRRYAAIIRAKQDRLHVLDHQAAIYGIDVPPHIAMERVSLEAELSAVETTLDSPIRASLGDELGPKGRFVVTYQQNLGIEEQNEKIRKTVAAMSVKLDRFIEGTETWRAMHRNWIIIVTIVVILILIAVVAIVTYLLTKGTL